jgi:hypothetical protein
MSPKCITALPTGPCSLHVILAAPESWDDATSQTSCQYIGLSFETKPCLFPQSEAHFISRQRPHFAIPTWPFASFQTLESSFC